MAKRSALVALLEAEFEPTQKYYNDIVDDVIKNPQLISGLSEETVRDDVLISLTTRHHRLARFFHRLLSVARQTSKSSTAIIIAAELVGLLIDILPDLHQLLETPKVLEFLVPALDVCFVSSQRPALCKLASVLVKSGFLLEHLVSEHLGVEVIRQWLSMQSPTTLDAETLSLWTNRLVSMVQGCAIDHDTTIETQQWHMLQDLKNSLQKMESDTLRASGKRYTPATRHDLPVLGSMKQLNREDKKSRLARHQDTTNTIPPLRDDDKRYLKAFDIRVPGSKSSLLDAIKRLEGEKTTAILLSIMSRLPCYLCVSSLGSAPQTARAETRNESFQPTSISQMEILDKGIGVWKVLLSPQALRSLLHLGSHGFVSSITQKLNDLASGCWDPKDQLLAGIKHQRKCLKVPVAQTECGQNQFILWQIAIGMDVETEVPQQEITVWEVCDYHEISKIIERVIFLQQSYSAETIRRCRQHSVTVDGTQIPARFEDASSHLIRVTRPSADLDVRTVDQDTIEMTNKFYALTEPVMHSILSNDLSAVFPFHLSREEVGVIRHFRTASLILGRSGTGKTTCLVFKLVGKYLASRAVVDEKPARQVLLTRSRFLADKLNSYTRQLIKTLLPKSTDLESLQPSEHGLSISAREDIEQCTVFTLRDTSFPLICTWESFLGILENTATKYDIPRLHDAEEPAAERSDEDTITIRSVYGQVVDFHVFKSDYWPHFSHALTKGLPVHLVFAEIMGVIKGSGSSRESLEPLNRQEYLTRSCRLAPTFVLESERSRVYEVFMVYEKLKLELGGVDYVDRVVKLIRAIRRDSPLNQLLRFTFDEVYIDEIQDQRGLDIELLLSFVKDGRGFHFAGDTAQAISQESTFRFSDIKALCNRACIKMQSGALRMLEMKSARQQQKATNWSVLQDAVNLIDDAARALVALGKSEDAAEILFLNERYSKAARLFAEADLSVKAVECFKLAGEYSEAAVIMNKKKDYDGLVFCLYENRDKISTEVLQSYRMLCKLLLKQQKTSIEFRKYAIKLLGSIAEQEKCFLDYGMDNELAGLYASQLRYIDLLHLCSKNGQLEQALSLAITKNLLQCNEDGVETEVLNLLDFVWAGHMQGYRHQHSQVPFKLPFGALTPKVKLRAEQWEACSLTCSLEGSVARQDVAGFSSNVPKTLFCLRSILNITTITGAKDLNDLPFEMMREAIDLTRDLILNKNGNALDIVLLHAGLWKPANGNGRLMVLPWSPLRELLAKTSISDYTKVVKQRVLDDLASAILALDTKARGLWKEKWPKRCAHFITIGFCPRKRKGDSCNWLHQDVSEQDCSQIVKDLLLVNGIFCDLAAIYYRRAMNETFQGQYLRTKRYWLEHLLRELTHLSAVEQHASTIAKTQAKLCYDREYIAILSSIEELLYHRLIKEWNERSKFTSLLEQLQLARSFGSNLQNRLFRIMSDRLILDKRGLMQRHLSLLISLTENVGCSNASLFQDKLMTFLVNLEKIEVPALLTLHSLTGVIEYLAAHLILKTCATACIIPSSWIELHITSTSKAVHSAEPLQGDDKHRYYGCLIQLAKGFCHILGRLDKGALPTDSFLCGGNTHQPLLLRQRNAELVAVIVANLAATFPEPPVGFNETWGRAKEVFEYDFIKAYHLRSRTPNDLTLRLPASFAKYNGKDALVVVIRNRTKGSPFHNLEHQPGVRTVTFDQLYPSIPTPAAAGISSEQPLDSAPVDGADAADDQYSAEETEAMIKIQRLWRSVSAKIKTRRSYVSIPLCRATARFFNLGAQCPDSVHGGTRNAIRKVLLSQGVGLALRLDGAKGLLSELQEDAMRCIVDVEIDRGVDQSVDEILCRTRDVEALLGEAEDKMSEDCLVGLVMDGVRSSLEKAFTDVNFLMVEIEESMQETRRMIGMVSTAAA